MPTTISPKRNSVDRNVAVAALLLTLGTILLQARWADQATARETFLFNVLQLLLTAVFGWFSNRAVNRDEFQRNLKQFAVSAYRRISDIEKMVRRLQKAAKTVAEEHRGDPRALEAIGAIADDTVEVVTSSTADWADVIGEEMAAVQTIKALQVEREGIAGSKDEDAADSRFSDLRRELDEKIDKLLQKLPAPMRVEALRHEFEGDALRHAHSWMSALHEAQDGMRVQLGVAGARADSVKAGETVFLRRRSKDEFGVDAYSGRNEELGRVFNNTPLGYEPFSVTLFRCYGTDSIPATVLSVLRTNGEGRVFELRVSSKPVPVPPRQESPGRRLNRRKQ